MRKFILIFAAAMLAHAADQTFTGTITDSMCAGPDHKAMNMGSDEKCVTECVKMGAKYALFDGKTAYTLSDQKNAAKFAAKKVNVTGTLDDKNKTIKVTSITPAQ